MYTGALDVELDVNEPYAFAASNQDELHEDVKIMRREVAWEVHMTYQGNDAKGLRFGLARPHQGDANYKGASGAPIVDRRGAIVGVLVGPTDQPDELRGAGSCNQGLPLPERRPLRYVRRLVRRRRASCRRLRS